MKGYFQFKSIRIHRCNCNKENNNEQHVMPQKSSFIATVKSGYVDEQIFPRLKFRQRKEQNACNRIALKSNGSNKILPIYVTLFNVRKVGLQCFSAHVEFCCRSKAWIKYRKPPRMQCLFISNLRTCKILLDFKNYPCKLYSPLDINFMRSQLLPSLSGDMSQKVEKEMPFLQSSMPRFCRRYGRGTRANQSFFLST